MKARFDDRVTTVRAVALESGETIPIGTHGFVIEAIESPERYEVEFDLESGQDLATVVPGGRWSRLTCHVLPANGDTQMT